MGIIRDLREDFNAGLMDNLRSITYDETGTKSPFVTKDLDNPPENKGLLLQVNKRVDDLTRISKLLINKPGLKFLAHEALLRQTNLTDKLRGNNKKLVGNIIRRVGGTAKQVAQVAASTLAQVPVNGTGTHFIRGFKADTYLQDSEPTGRFGQLFGAGGIEGAKYSLRGEPVPSLGLITNSEVPKRNTTASPGFIGKNHIGIVGDVSTETDISFYTENLPYFSNTISNISNINNGENASPQVGSVSFGIKDSTSKPFDLGIDKFTTFAIGPGAEKIDYNPNLANNINSPGLSYIGRKTEKNIISANAGVPIPNPEGKGTLKIFGIQTTASPGSIGISNKNIKGNITKDSSYNITPFSTTAIDATRYTTATTTDNIIAARANTGIFFKKSPENLKNSSYTVEPNLYNKVNTYTIFKTKDNINTLKLGVAFTSDGMFPLRSNVDLDPIGNTSTGIPDPLVPLSASHNGSNSTIPGKARGAIEDFRSKGGQFYFNANGEKVEVPKSSTDFTGRAINTYALDYGGTKINKETRVKLGNQGKISRKRTKVTDSSDIDVVDQVNAFDVLTKTKAKGKRLDGYSAVRDLIQLNFDIFTPEEEYYLAFRAFLDTFDDSFNASWNSHKYLGRGEDFYTYGGFDRSISIGFKIAAATRQEMKPLYRKVATLASVTAPSYGENGRFMRGAISEVTVGDYIYRQPGIIESVQYTWQNDYPWEISFDNPENPAESSQILPHVLDVQITFKVIHDFLPETGILPFITNHKETPYKKPYIPLEEKVQTVKEEVIEESTENNNEEVVEEEVVVDTPEIDIREFNEVAIDKTEVYKPNFQKSINNLKNNLKRENILSGNQEFDFSNIRTFDQKTFKLDLESVYKVGSQLSEKDRILKDLEDELSSSTDRSSVELASLPVAVVGNIGTVVVSYNLPDVTLRGQVTITHTGGNEDSKDLITTQTLLKLSQSSSTIAKSIRELLELQDPERGFDVPGSGMPTLFEKTTVDQNGKYKTTIVIKDAATGFVGFGESEGTSNRSSIKTLAHGQAKLDLLKRIATAKDSGIFE